MINKAMTVHDLYDLHTSLIMRIMLQPNSSCIDVGAHVGSILSEIVKLCPKGQHYAFEPIPSLFEQLRINFPQVTVYNFACSDSEGESEFFYVRNDPAYSGLKKRRYDRSDPDIEKIVVKKSSLDGLIPSGQPINFIKIDVEGGELPVLRGAKRIIAENKPVIIFESGLGASDYYGTTGEKVYDYLVPECGLEVNTLDGFLSGASPLTREALVSTFNTVSRYYFIACNPQKVEERVSHMRSYLLYLDIRLFELENRTSTRIANISNMNNMSHSQIRSWMNRIATSWSSVFKGSAVSVQVTDWGPQVMVLGNIPNKQSNGGLGLWIRVSGNVSLGDVQLVFCGHHIPAYVSDGLITAEIPPEFFALAGNYEILMKNASNSAVYPVGTFVINPN